VPRSFQLILVLATGVLLNFLTAQQLPGVTPLAFSSPNIVMIYVDDMLFWKPHAGGAVRQGQWKLLVESWGQGKLRLFDLENDLAEENDLAVEKPELVEQLHQAWLDWSKDYPIAASKRKKSG
jgi:hypothetical protein